MWVLPPPHIRYLILFFVFFLFIFLRAQWKSRINTHIFYAAVWTDSRAAEEGWLAVRQEGLKYKAREKKTPKRQKRRKSGGTCAKESPDAQLVNRLKWRTDSKLRRRLLAQWSRSSSDAFILQAVTKSTAILRHVYRSGDNSLCDQISGQEMKKERCQLWKEVLPNYNPCKRNPRVFVFLQSCIRLLQVMLPSWILRRSTDWLVVELPLLKATDRIPAIEIK